MTTIILIILAAIFKAVCDKIQFHFSTCVFRKLGLFWNPKESWRTKWKNGNKKEGEAFFMSSTWLVGFTDAWHLFQSLQWTAIILSILFFNPITSNLIYDFIILRFIVYPCFFHVFFTYIFNTRTNKTFK